MIILLNINLLTQFCGFHKKNKICKTSKVTANFVSVSPKCWVSLYLHLAHLVNSKLTLHWEYNKCCTTVAVFFQWKVNAQRLTCCLQAQAQSRKKRVYKFYQTKLSFIFTYFIFLNCIYLFFYFIYFFNCIYYYYYFYFFLFIFFNAPYLNAPYNAPYHAPYHARYHAPRNAPRFFALSPFISLLRFIHRFLLMFGVCVCV